MSDMSRMFQKGDFEKLKVVGQFNKGFIMCTLNDDIFIIDQHACDEKINFEKLSRTTQLHTQDLIMPISVTLGAAEAMTLSLNLEVFKMNGFKVDPSDTNTFFIKSLPYSK